MKLTTLESLLVEELKDLYDGEKQITKALPRMAKAATSRELTTAFERHLDQTKEHVARLERVFDELGKSPGRKKCEGIAGLVEEGKEILKNSVGADPAVRDAALIAAAQRIEHYEMAGYGTVRAWAEQLGLNSAARILQQTLDDEKATDKRLSEIANVVNVEAEH
jgi:ferritin-like metal-binding protein YciE